MWNQVKHQRTSKKGKMFNAGKGEIKSAKEEVGKLGFKSGKTDVTDNFIRFRQESPEKFDKFRTLDVGRKGHTKLVLGIDTKGTTTKKDDETKVQSVLIKRK